jgi:uncharacterized membrane-anchored protein
MGGTAMDHELRSTLNDEVHGRPALPVSAPARVAHFAFTHDDDGEAAAAHVVALAAQWGVAAPSVKFGHLVLTAAEGLVKWERHGEFSTLTVVGRAGATVHECAEASALADWLSRFPGKRIVAVDALILRSPAPAEAALLDFFGSDEIAGSMVNGRLATVWSGFRIGPDGMTRMLITLDGMSEKRIGRLVRRLLEVETYRMMALLAFPVARQIGPKLNAIDTSIGQVVAGLPYARNADEESDLLTRLTEIARDIEVVANIANYRFAAANAYDALVTKRLSELREERIEGYQRWQTFLDRRMGPAMATCRAAAARIESLAQRAERASHLLRTRVDIVVERQNYQLLQSMETRARQQVKLQETVEGLSVVAISYYAIALLAKLVEGVAEMGAPFRPVLVEAALAPIVVLSVWSALQSARKSWAAAPFGSAVQPRLHKQS